MNQPAVTRPPFLPPADSSPALELKNPPLAALLAWLWPGAGHIYQARYGKGILFMVCILGTYFFGLGLGDGRVVYAAFKRPDVRWPFLLQAGVGIPAFPAVYQAARNRPRSIDENPPKMAPPQTSFDQLSQWHKTLGRNFELGTLYTMIAGLLNILAVFDAYGGPAHLDQTNREDQPPPQGEPAKT
ncbi:MAG: DUF6677 family protein [Pirellulales bacterium]